MHFLNSQVHLYINTIYASINNNLINIYYNMKLLRNKFHNKRLLTRTPIATRTL